MTWRVHSFFGRWLLSTATGWLLGLVLVSVLAGIWSDVTGGEAQFMVGIGMGAGVGFMQARIPDFPVRSPRAWLRASIAGMGIPFVAWDISARTGINVPYPLQLFVLAGALLAGIVQANLLQKHYRRAIWWVPACVIGREIPAVLASFRNVGILQPLSIVLGGLLLGAATGFALLRMPKKRSDPAMH